MKKSMFRMAGRWFLGVSLLLPLVLMSSAWAKELHFAVCLPTLDQPHFIAQKWGYEDEAKRQGVKLTIYDAGGYANLNRQIQQIEDATAAKVDAIILVSVSQTGTIPVVEDAVKAGIPVINVNVMCESPKIIARVRSDDSEIGSMAGEFLAKKLNYQGNIVMLPGKAGTSVVMIRAEGLKKAIGKYPNIKILAEQYSEMTRAEGMRIMEDLFQTHGKAINGVYAVGEHLGMGAAQTLDAAKRRDVVICAVDFSKDLEQALKDGRIAATVTQQTIMMGRLGVRLSKDVAEGKKVPPMTFCPIKLITSEDLDKIDRSGFQIPSK
jgi:ABC-type sugar transport system substrate-binding protein